jgi:hypothetical protein
MLEYRNKKDEPKVKLPFWEIVKNVAFVVFVFTVFILFLKVL